MSKKHPVTRRQFLGTAATTAALASSWSPLARTQEQPASGTWDQSFSGFRAVSSLNGLKSVEISVQQMQAGRSPVDAAVAGVNVVELDPNDLSVGYGGLPNERGVVELDSAVMDGPTHNAGGVASLRGIKTPSRVALKVMRRTDHCLLVGQGALEFAKAHGFVEEDLLTDRSRKLWLYWKETLSNGDDWLPPSDDELAQDPVLKGKRPPGTIHLSARNADEDLGCVTTTSGLAFKIPGRVGDSPLIGDGLYLDNEIGSAGSTGRGEAVILSCGSFAIVERMRSGRSPQQACLDVLERIVDQSRRNGLVDEQGRPTFNVNFYAIAKDGRYAGAALYQGAKFAVADDVGGARAEASAYLFERS